MNKDNINIDEMIVFINNHIKLFCIQCGGNKCKNSCEVMKDLENHRDNLLKLKRKLKVNNES